MFWAPLMATSAALLIGHLIESILVHLAHPSKACLRGDVTRVGLQLSHSVNWHARMNKPPNNVLGMDSSFRVSSKASQNYLKRAGGARFDYGQ
jgi:hypothetical protein